jgi:hypothetical protein
MIRPAALVAILPAFALLASPAAAQDASGLNIDSTGRQQFEIAALAPPACLVGSGTSTGGSNAAFQADGATGGIVQITALADPDTAQGNAAEMQVIVPVICNSAHAITVSSANGGLLRSGGARASLGGFLQFLPYRVDYTWAGQDVSGASDTAAALGLQVPSPGQGDLQVAISLAATDTPLVAGSYEDTLLIEITAAN